ncbi:MAG TPA: serine hydrolase, partial [Verrucomicrobiae bacterium]
MKRWLVLSPIPVSTNTQPDDTAQTSAFAMVFLKSAGGEAGVRPAAGQRAPVGDKDYEWRLVASQSEIIELSGGAAAMDFRIAYAWAEIEMKRAATLLFGLGSDDAIKVWLNGRLVHENWVQRMARPDDDLVELHFQKGKNQLLLKVQNRQGNWGFACRPLSAAGLEEKLVGVAGRGDLDEIKKLLARGVSVNGKDKRGLTPWQAARIHGHKEVAQFLQSQGARARMPRKLESVLDGTFKDIVHDGWSGAAVLVAQNGKILFEKGYGLANLEHRVPVTTETKFRIGSITKQFIAAAILKLREQGKLNLDDRLSKFIPDFPRGGEVTIHHLLTHTSGIHSYTSKPDFIETAPLFIKPEDLIQSFKNDPYEFDPGKKWSYNNSGFFLLGDIIEKVSGKAYEEFLRTTFFEPLGMTNTGVHHGTEVLEHEAQGYAFESGRMKKALNWDMSRAGGAGALYSTVGDLYRWNEAVFNGKVLNDASLKAAFTPVKTTENKSEKLEEGYGCGWAIGKLRGLKQISHGGGLDGFISYLLRVPEERLTVVVLANASPPPPGLDTSAL